MISMFPHKLLLRLWCCYNLGYYNGRPISNAKAQRHSKERGKYKWVSLANGRGLTGSRNVNHTKRSHLRQSARTWPRSRQISCKVRAESAKGKALPHHSQRQTAAAFHLTAVNWITLSRELVDCWRWLRPVVRPPCLCLNWHIHI